MGFVMNNKVTPSGLEANPIKLNEVVVSVLSNDSYNKLSQPEKNIYDRFMVKDRDGIGLPPVDVQSMGAGRQFSRVGSENNREISVWQAMKLATDSGIKNIRNKPSFFSKLFPKDMNIVRNRKRKRGGYVGGQEYHSFRAHANPVKEEIYIQKPKGWTNRYVKDLFAEAAHMPKYYNPHTNLKGVLYGLYKTLTGKQKEMYNEPGNYESYTHDTIEPELVKKYSTKYKY